MRVCLPVQGTWVQSLVGKLRSRVLHGIVKKKDTRWKEKSIQGQSSCVWIEVGIYRGIQNEAGGTSQTWNSHCKEGGYHGSKL